MREREELAEAVAQLEEMAAVRALRSGKQRFHPTRIATYRAHSDTSQKSAPLTDPPALQFDPWGNEGPDFDTWKRAGDWASGWRRGPPRGCPTSGQVGAFALVPSEVPDVPCSCERRKGSVALPIPGSH